MNRNDEIREILRSREIAARQRQEQREAARKRKHEGRVDILAFGYVRDSHFPTNIFKR